MSLLSCCSRVSSSSRCNANKPLIRLAQPFCGCRLVLDSSDNVIKHKRRNLIIRFEIQFASIHSFSTAISVWIKPSSTVLDNEDILRRPVTADIERKYPTIRDRQDWDMDMVLLHSASSRSKTENECQSFKADYLGSISLSLRHTILELTSPWHLLHTRRLGYTCWTRRPPDESPKDRTVGEMERTIALSGIRSAPSCRFGPLSSLATCP